MKTRSVPLKVAVLVSGRGSNLDAILNAIDARALSAEVAIVVSDKGDAKALDIAHSRGIPTAVIPRFPKRRSAAQFNTLLADIIEPFHPGLVILAGFMRVLTGEFISRFHDRVINIHPSLLPAFPGLNVQQKALDAGVRFAGCTVHFVVEEVDAGPIIAQAVVPVCAGDTADILAARILAEEHRLLPAVVHAFSRQTVRLVHRDGKRFVELDAKAPLGALPTDALRSLVTSAK